MTYDPRPLDVSHVKLPEQLADAVELLAEQVHDAWARRRLDEGWTHGPCRDDARKTHPSLVPYRELPASEKAYDRQTALHTLCMLVKLGYRIQPPATTDAKNR